MGIQISYCIFKEGGICTNPCKELPSSAFTITPSDTRYCDEKEASDELISCSKAEIKHDSILPAGDEIEEDSW